MNLDALEIVRGTIWLYPCHPSPKVAQLSAKRDHLLPTEGEREYVSEYLVSTDVQDSAKEVYFSLTPARVLSHDVHD